MADEIKRVHYYDQQFLRAEDFIAEQEYHMKMRQLHNLSAQHGIGVVDGLVVIKNFENSNSENTKKVIVTRGMAIDSEGREVVLLEDFKDLDVHLHLSGPGIPPHGLYTVYVAIQYHEELTDEPNQEFLVSVDDRTRVTVWAMCNVYAKKSDVPAGAIILAAVDINGDETIGEIRYDERMNQQVARYHVPLVSHQYLDLKGFLNDLGAVKALIKETSSQLICGIMPLDLPHKVTLIGFGANASFDKLKDSTLTLELRMSYLSGTPYEYEILNITQTSEKWSKFNPTNWEIWTIDRKKYSYFIFAHFYGKKMDKADEADEGSMTIHHIWVDYLRKPSPQNAAS